MISTVKTITGTETERYSKIMNTQNQTSIVIPQIQILQRNWTGSRSKEVRKYELALHHKSGTSSEVLGENITFS